MVAPLIEFRDVTKRFEGQVVLDRVNLEIYESQISTIIGKSGTGKSVLLKHIIGLLKPDEGTILFKGVPVDRMDRHELDNYRKQFSYLFQDNALFDSMTVFDNIALPLRQTTRMKSEGIRNRVMKSLEQTELTEALQKYPSELSGGMQKRVALARALVTDPVIVLFDEPTTGQDPIRKHAILSMVAEYRKKFGFTAILISHDIPDIFFISDRIILLWEGTIAFQGSYREMSSSLDNPAIQEFLSSLEGFQDELTGLLSKKTFNARYDSAFLRRGIELKGTAVLFSIELESLCQTLGHVGAVQVLRNIGTFIHERIDALGGFSARQDIDQILTIMPRANLNEAKAIVDLFAKEIQDLRLCEFGEGVLDIEGETCFDINICAGIAEVKGDTDIDSIIERAGSIKNIIVKYKCEVGGVKS